MKIGWHENAIQIKQLIEASTYSFVAKTPGIPSCASRDLGTEVGGRRV
ncbi:MAG: hypothetical protein KKB51_00275 [Candidatus Riflebacteria bacterium]|nr:hypothetical protein [Candidatus Riflebacteria bacterium]